jgi:hypothetical protein
VNGESKTAALEFGRRKAMFAPRNVYFSPAFGSLKHNPSTCQETRTFHGAGFSLAIFLISAA